MSKKKNEGIYQQLSSLKELEEHKLCIVEDDIEVVGNNILKILEEKGLTIADLATITGISRQNINAVVRGKMKPGIDFVLKIAYVLGVSVEELFYLTKDAWIRPFKYDRDVTLYIDLIHMAIIDTKKKREFISETNYEYFNVHTKEQLTKEEYERRLKNYIEDRKDKLIEEMKETNSDMTVNQIKSAVVESLREEFHQEYTKIYKKLGKRFEPYVVE